MQKFSVNNLIESSLIDCQSGRFQRANMLARQALSLFDLNDYDFCKIIDIMIRCDYISQALDEVILRTHNLKKTEFGRSVISIAIQSGINSLRTSVMKKEHDKIDDLSIRLLHLAPDNPDVLSCIGIGYFIRNKTKNACSFLRKAIEIDPNNHNIFMNISMMLQYSLTNSPERLESAQALGIDNFDKKVAKTLADIANRLPNQWIKDFLNKYVDLCEVVSEVIIIATENKDISISKMISDAFHSGIIDYNSYYDASISNLAGEIHKIYEFEENILCNHGLDPVSLGIYKTTDGIFALPNDATFDIVVNVLKSGRSFDDKIIRAAQSVVKAGDTILDLGANFGLATIQFAKMVGQEGKVYAVEGSSHVSRHLSATIRLNNINNTKVFNEILFDGSKKKFSFLNESLADHRYGDQSVSSDISNNGIESKSIDELFYGEKISLIKIDLEGCEIPAINGGIRTIEKYRPIIIFEYTDAWKRFGYSFEDGVNLFEKLGYVLKTISGNENGGDFFAFPREHYKNIQEI